MKKVLIVSMTCGEGHNAIARSISKKLEDKGAKTNIIQLFGYSQKRVERENKSFLKLFIFFKFIIGVLKFFLLHLDKY